MKHLITLLFLVACALAEVPSPPYPASGWRPEGPSFELPSVESNSHSKQAVAPAQRGPPSTSYGVPQTPGQESFVLQNQASQSRYAASPQKGRQNLTPLNRFVAPLLQRQLAPAPPTYFVPPGATQPQTQYGAPTKQEQAPQKQREFPQSQYGTPQQQQLPQNQYGAPQQQSPGNKLETPQQQQLPQNQYGAPQQQAPQNQYGAPQLQTEVRLSHEQQLQLLKQLLMLQQFLSTQSRQEVPTLQNQYGAPTPSVDVRSGGSGNRPQTSSYEPPLFVEPLNGVEPPPTTQYLPSFTSAADFRPEQQRTVPRSQKQDQSDEEYKTIVLTKQEQEEYNRKYGPPVATTNRPVVKRRQESTTGVPNEDNDEESFDDASGDPNIAVATAVADGKYYLLLPDGKLQKVTYKTTQTEEEAKTNGFTASLMYQLVDPIKDPIYTVDGVPYVPENQN